MKPITLQNTFLLARFTQSGALIHLSRPGQTKSLLARAAVRYGKPGGVPDNTGEGVFPDETETMTVLRVDARPDAGVIETELQSPLLTITRRWTLTPGSPVLHVHCSVRGRSDLAAPVKINPAFPQLDFAPGFYDSFEDEEDLYAPGIELPAGRQTPPWHVFFRKGHRDGLIVTAPSKYRMAQLSILAQSIRGNPHELKNYSSDPVAPMEVTSKTKYDAEFAFGPWRKADHAKIVRAARLNEATVVTQDRPRGKRMKRKAGGVIIPAAKLAPKNAVTTGVDPRKWQVVSLPWTLNAKSLFAGTGVSPPAIKFTPKQRGLHRIYVGIGNGRGVAVQAAGDRYPTVRGDFLVSDDGQSHNPFSLYLTGKHRGKEIEIGVFDLKGKPLTINPPTSRLSPCVLDYIRLEKLTPSAAAKWRRQEDAEPCIPLSGLSDTPDIAVLDDPTSPDPDVYRACIWEHARAKVRRIYWRIDGQCSDFPSKHNTMRYVSAKVHGVFSPGAKAYGKVLRKVNMLKLAVDEAHKYNLELYGWMRFNNYSGNVQSDFFKNNPQWRERNEAGREQAKLCLAFPEVRDHKLNILTEAAGYGVDGLNLGFLRHPPVFMFHPVMIEGYKKKFGEAPPIIPGRPDDRFLNRLPPADEASTRWYQYRADFLTTFGRDLKQRLRDMGKSHVKIAVWVRPNHCLFDGIDLPTWLNEGLCDEVVINGMIGPERVYSNGNGKEYDPVVCGVSPEWRAMIQPRAQLIRCLTYLPLKWWRPHLKEVFAEGYDGLCTYESNMSVVNSAFVEFYRSLRK